MQKELIEIPFGSPSVCSGTKISESIYRCTFSIYKKTADKDALSSGNHPNHFWTLVFLFI